MPLKLTEIQRSEATFTVSYLGETVEVVYNPGKLTYGLRVRLVLGSQAYLPDAQATKARAIQDAWSSYHADLATLLVRWDVLDDAGKPLPPTKELLEQMPQEFVNALLTALLEHQTINPQSGKGSDATSKAEA